ncbi:PEROXISOMAL MEMBRANE 22 KDA (MPV17/PMP22) FAMILY PROTEIN [Salix purpurea]|uniref:PEROXISOMAL MEMBRANE 22 kDa (MPV17/PMP22) FAMILY PROTEIN n=1 Tax=Salix purpurea TaxID=77065 RepID=A0A9Q0UM34_SALPP|nr:PEROXISOMAL MEMBRANE 22 KDA (MPV17/PMP22) FAMILY PROTEIN [Salix purpurea]
MGFASGKSVPQIKEDLKRDFVPALILEGGIWPIVQVANFRFIPVRYQLLYVNFFCLLDSCFLSWLEQQEDAPLEAMVSISSVWQGEASIIIVHTQVREHG